MPRRPGSLQCTPGSAGPVPDRRACDPSRIRERAEPQSLAAAGPGSDTRHPRANDRRPVNLEPGLDAVHGAPSATRLAPRDSGQRHSLVLDVARGGRHLLLTGDLDQLGLVELVAQAQPVPIDLMLAPHHGGKSANPLWLFSWAKPRAVVVSQRPSVSGTTDALSPVERGGIPLLRTWERGAIHFRWSFDRILTQGFLDRDDRPHVPLTGLGAN